MADRAIKVAVLEGDFAALSNLGLPISVSIQLQEMGRLKKKINKK